MPEASLLTLWFMSRFLACDVHDTLWLLPGLPVFGAGRDWVVSGKGTTGRFGGLDVWAHMTKHGELDIDLESRFHTVPKEIKLRITSPVRRVEADGKNVSADGQILRFGPRVKKIHIETHAVAAPVAAQEVE